MARDFNNDHTAFLSLGGSLISNIDPRPISVACWLYDTGNDTRHWIYTNNYNNSDPAWGCLVRDVSGTWRMSIYCNSGYRDSSVGVTLNLNAWNHFVWTHAADNSMTFYHDGSAVGTQTRAVSGGGTTDGAAIGTLTGAFAAFDIDGYLAEFAVWNAVLSAGEAAALGDGFAPPLVRRANMVSYCPIFGNASPEIDAVAGNWTVNGTLVKAVHKPMIYPTVPLILGVPAAAAGGLSIPIAMHHYKQMMGTG